MAKDKKDDGFWHMVSQWFTPPKSKSPWTAMTAGSSGEWAEGVEDWGPAIMSAMSLMGPYTYGLGYLGAGIGGAAGMGGKGTGYLGSDYGDANWGSTIGGAASGVMSGTPMGWLGGLGQGGMSLFNGGYDDENSVNPQANKYNSSWYGGMGNLLQPAGQWLGRGGGWSGNLMNQTGGQLGQSMNVFNGQNTTNRVGQGDLGALFPFMSSFQQPRTTPMYNNYRIPWGG